MAPRCVVNQEGSASLEFIWVTDFYTPPALRGAALFAVQRQRCVKFRALRAQHFYTSLALSGNKGSTSQHWRGTKIQSPIIFVLLPSWGSYSRSILRTIKAQVGGETCTPSELAVCIKKPLSRILRKLEEEQQQEFGRFKPQAGCLQLVCVCARACVGAWVCVCVFLCVFLCVFVAQCSATPATVAATPPATPFQTQISVRHLAQGGGEGATPKFLGGVVRHRCYTCKTL